MAPRAAVFVEELSIYGRVYLWENLETCPKYDTELEALKTKEIGKLLSSET